ncbi:Uncharacterized protein dnm_067510 [Desulfonema magnum]|uniref:Uncharacterized protein n=1 Tax=Desulfonema magnum TaxID=45655 RepID=A0A975GR98_9BACT|nr:Uncharacterized protein dnm_067510 [Desulfonema magnum]
MTQPATAQNQVNYICHKGTKSHEVSLCFLRVFVSLWRRRQVGFHKDRKKSSLQIL